MIKYKYVNRKPNKKEQEEILYYIHNKEFMEILIITGRYYIQGYHGDYEYVLQIENDTKFISIRIY